MQVQTSMLKLAMMQMCILYKALIVNLQHFWRKRQSASTPKSGGLGQVIAERPVIDLKNAAGMRFVAVDHLV
jgi:hypothetical protein